MNKDNSVAGQMTPPSKSRPAGWKLVPVEPTPQMITAGNDAAVNGGCDLWQMRREVQNAYRAMLAAAPEVGGMGDGSSCAPADVVAGQGTTALASKREPVTHELKAWPPYFAAVCSGEKPFEVRRHDRDYRVGDFLSLREWDPDIEGYTGRSAVVRVTYLLPGGDFGIGENHCVMGVTMKLRGARPPEREAVVPRAAATPQPAQAEPLDR